MSAALKASTGVSTATRLASLTTTQRKIIERLLEEERHGDKNVRKIEWILDGVTKISPQDGLTGSLEAKLLVILKRQPWLKKNSDYHGSDEYLGTEIVDLADVPPEASAREKKKKRKEKRKWDHDGENDIWDGAGFMPDPLQRSALLHHPLTATIEHRIFKILFMLSTIQRSIASHHRYQLARYLLINGFMEIFRRTDLRLLAVTRLQSNPVAVIVHLVHSIYRSTLTTAMISIVHTVHSDIRHPFHMKKVLSSRTLNYTCLARTRRRRRPFTIQSTTVSPAQRGDHAADANHQTDDATPVQGGPASDEIILGPPITEEDHLSQLEPTAIFRQRLSSQEDLDFIAEDEAGTSDILSLL